MRSKGLRRLGSIKIYGNRKPRIQDVSKPKSPEFIKGTGRLGKAKYRNRKVLVNGIKFDSKREADVYQQLKVLEEAGAISNLEVQPKYTFPCRFGDRVVRYQRVPDVRSKAEDGMRTGKPITYYADFKYTESDGTERVIDVKGYDTPVSRLKRGLMWSLLGINVEIVG